MTEYKALTVINLPFVGKMWQPGEMISDEDFEANASGNEVASPADEEIQSLLDAGAISEDPDAPLHPDHVPVDYGTLSINAVVAQARTLVEQLQSEGKEIPEELASFAQLDVRGVMASDVATSNEKEGE